MTPEQLKTTRQSLNLTQEQLALSLGQAPIYATTISKMERGVRKVPNFINEAISTL